MIEMTLNQIAEALGRALTIEPAGILQAVQNDYAAGVFDAVRTKPKPAIFDSETVAAVVLTYAAFPDVSRPARRQIVRELLAVRTPPGGEWELLGHDGQRAGLAGLTVDARGISHAIPRALSGEEITLTITDRASDAEGVTISHFAFDFASVRSSIPADMAEALDAMRGWRTLRTIAVPAGELIRLALAEAVDLDL